jgi:hypothetical protein
MRTLLLFICLASFSNMAFCQQIVIKSGNKITLQLSKDTSGNYVYTVVETERIKGNIGMDNPFLKDKVDSNQVKIMFGRGKAGDRDESLLIIKSGLNAQLQYVAKVKYTGSDDFKVTDVEPLFPNVESEEMWPDEILEVILSDFKKMNFN